MACFRLELKLITWLRTHGNGRWNFGTAIGTDCQLFLNLLIVKKDVIICQKLNQKNKFVQEPISPHYFAEGWLRWGKSEGIVHAGQCKISHMVIPNDAQPWGTDKREAMEI
jgi:hypothetical protein